MVSEEFTMWVEDHPACNPDTTTRCNACMVLEQERKRQEEEIRRSNLAQVVVLSAERDEQPGGQGTERKRTLPAKTGQQSAAVSTSMPIEKRAAEDAGHAAHLHPKMQAR
jgi:hypothetical protein